MQMVPRRSESQRLPQEAALVFRTYAIWVQSSYG
jgi:hypothetical protein